MKFIVLSYDRNLACADFVIRQYLRLWPDAPFTFRVPYNELIPGHLFSGIRDRIEFIKTPSDIRATVDNLTRDLDQDEWVFWNLDDKYPTELASEKLQAVYESLNAFTDKQIKAVQITRNRAGEFKDDVLPYRYATFGGREYLQKYNYRSFFQPHFIRLHHLRNIMVDNDIDGELKEDNKHLGIMPRVDQMLAQPLPDDEKVFCSKESLLCFGETMTNGKLTLNAQDEFKASDIPLPDLPLLDEGWWTNQQWQLIRVTKNKNGDRRYKRLRHHSDPVEKCLNLARKVKKIFQSNRPAEIS